MKTKPLSTKLAGLRAVLAFDNWPMLLVGRLFDRRAGMVIYRKRGLEILVDHQGGDEVGTRLCIATDMYTRYLPHFSLAGPLRVLDLGANGGGFALMLRIEGFEFERVVCVEMNPSTWRRLLLNVTANIGSAAVAINAAVCGREQGGEILIAASRGGTSESMYAGAEDGAQQRVAVPAVTLSALYDRYFSPHPVDICKVDIEAAEYEAFDATPDDVLRRMRYLIVEFHDPERAPAVIARLAAMGFEPIAAERHRIGALAEIRAFRGPAA